MGKLTEEQKDAEIERLRAIEAALLPLVEGYGGLLAGYERLLAEYTSLMDYHEALRHAMQPEEIAAAYEALDRLLNQEAPE